MIQDHITLKNRYKEFITKVCESKIVYVLKIVKLLPTNNKQLISDIR